MMFEMICILITRVILACEAMPVCDPWDASLPWEVLSCPANAQPQHILIQYILDPPCDGKYMESDSLDPPFIQHQ